MTAVLPVVFQDWLPKTGKPLRTETPNNGYPTSDVVIYTLQLPGSSRATMTETETVKSEGATENGKTGSVTSRCTAKIGPPQADPGCHLCMQVAVVPCTCRYDPAADCRAEPWDSLGR